MSGIPTNAQDIVLLFDIDGTLIDSGGAGGRALLQALQAEFDIDEAKPVGLHGRTDFGIMGELLESHGIEATQTAIEQLCGHYFAILPDYLGLGEGRVLPGVLEILDGLAARTECQMGVLTGNMETSAIVKLKHYCLDHFFPFGVYGDVARHRRDLCAPALQCIRQQLNRDVPAQQIVIIGDTPLDVELAKMMQARCLAVCTGGFDTQSLVLAGADLVLDDLSDTERIVHWLF